MPEGFWMNPPVARFSETVSALASVAAAARYTNAENLAIAKSKYEDWRGPLWASSPYKRCSHALMRRRAILV